MTVVRTPAMDPTRSEIPKFAVTPEAAPIATPPARLPLRISLMLNRPRQRIEAAKEVRQLPVKDTIVLEIMRERWKLLVGK